MTARILPVLDLVPPAMPLAGPRAAATAGARVAEFRPEDQALPRFWVWTLGCQMNRSDSEEMAGRLLAAGCAEAPGMEAADLVVINTCAIREAAEAKVIGRQGALSALKSANPGLRVVLTGCAVRERDRAGLRRRFPAVDLFLRPDEEPEIVERLGLASAQAAVGLGETSDLPVPPGSLAAPAAPVPRPRPRSLRPGARWRRRERRPPRSSRASRSPPPTTSRRPGPRRSRRAPCGASRRSPRGCRSSTGATRPARTASCRSAAGRSAAGRSIPWSTRRAPSRRRATARSRSSARTSTATATTCRRRRGSPTSPRRAGPGGRSIAPRGRTSPS